MKHKNNICKYLLPTALLLLLLMLLTACTSNASPASVTGNFLNAVKEADFETAAGYTDLSETDLADRFSPLEKGIQIMNPEMVFDEPQLNALEEFRQKLTDFDYEISDEQTEGDSATVRVTFTTYDFSAFMRTFLPAFFTEVMEPAEDGTYDNSQLDNELTAKFFESYEACKEALDEKAFSFYADFTLEKTDHGWIITDLDPDLPTALTGGLDSY